MFKNLLFSIKSFGLEYWNLLKTNKKFLIIQNSMIAIILLIAINNHSMLSLFCVLYCYLVMVSAACIEIYDSFQQVKKCNLQLKEIDDEREILDFWNNECEKLHKQWSEANANFKTQEANEISKQYENAYNKYKIELEKVSKKYNLL